MASQEAIKQLGTNGGGFFNANAAHPFENPNAFSNILQIWSMLTVSAALLDHVRPDGRRRRQGWALLAAVGVILLSAASRVVYWAETAGNPLLTALGVDPAQGNHGRQGSPLRPGADRALCRRHHRPLLRRASTPCTTRSRRWAASCRMFLIQLGEVLPGGVGSGLYGMVVFAMLSVFVAGLMVGRTPEFLGKKIEAREMKLAMLAVLILPLAILGFTAVSAVLPVGAGQPRQRRARTASRKSSTPTPRRRATTARPSPASPPTRPGSTPRSASPCCSAASPMSCR